MSSEVVIEGYERLRGKIDWLLREAPGDLDKTMGEWRVRTRNKLPGHPYPPRPPGSTYRRTGRLASWATRRNALLEHAFLNNASYAGWVVGKGMQANIHQGRWPVAETAVEAEVPALLEDAVTLYTRVWAG